jgi:hypothetical protein
MHRPQRAPPLRMLRASFVASIVVLSACGEPAASSPDVQGSPSTGDASSSGSATSAPSVNPTTGPAPGPNVIAWILDLGPGAPQGPPEFQAYSLLLNRQCAELAQGLEPDGSIVGLEDAAVRLYAAAADACLAALYGQTERWDAALAAFQALDRPVSCVDVAAFALLGRLLEAHAQNPSAGFQANSAPSSEGTPPCPAITAIDPTHGPSGTQVQVTGTNLDHVNEVVVFIEDDQGSQFRDPEPDPIEHVPGTDLLIVTVEDETNVGLFACIVLRGATDWNGAGARFTIDDAPPLGFLPSGGANPVPTAACPPPSE